MRRIILGGFLVLSFLAFFGCKSLATPGSDYSIPRVDLSQMPARIDDRFAPLFELSIVDDGSEDGSVYMAHPDSVLLLDGGILILYPQGHGMGPVIGKISRDGGKSWGSRLADLPASWAESKETPTVYRLGDPADPDDPYRNHLVMTSANPSWSGLKGRIYGHNRFKGDGFNASFSADDGATWTDFENFYGYREPGYVNPIVAMASLTRLKKADGSWDDKWMGFFHDYSFVNYKTILTFDEAGNMQWSRPEPYFSEYRSIEKGSNMCEVEVVRSEGGKGDVLCLITRSNTKKTNTLISFSRDEGESWSEPAEAPAALNGERHKAEWLPDGRLFITFRSIERDPQKNAEHSERPRRGWYSEGWTGWVGTFEDLQNGTEGEYRVKLAHTYLDGQAGPSAAANADTGYCGNVVLPDGSVVTASYGTFGEIFLDDEGRRRFKTYITAKRIDMSLLDEYVEEFGRRN